MSLLVPDGIWVMHHTTAERPQLGGVTDEESLLLCL